MALKSIQIRLISITDKQGLRDTPETKRYHNMSAYPPISNHYCKQVKRSGAAIEVPIKRATNNECIVKYQVIVVNSKGSTPVLRREAGIQLAAKNKTIVAASRT